MEKVYAYDGAAKVSGGLSAATTLIGCIGSGFTQDGILTLQANTAAETVFLALMLAGAFFLVIFVRLQKYADRLRAEHEARVNPSGNECKTLSKREIRARRIEAENYFYSKYGA